MQEVLRNEVYSNAYKSDVKNIPGGQYPIRYVAIKLTYPLFNIHLFTRNFTFFIKEKACFDLWNIIACATCVSLSPCDNERKVRKSAETPQNYSLKYLLNSFFPQFYYLLVITFS